MQDGNLQTMGCNHANPQDSENDVVGRNEMSRIFSRQIKRDCWGLAGLVSGRHPSRWRLDALGNVVCHKLTGCDGCLCHEYDHIVPFSRGGQSVLSNCQILQTRVNRMKGSQENDCEKMRGYSCDYSFGQEDLDVLELALYGDIQRFGRNCRCPSVMESLIEFRVMVMKKGIPPCRKEERS